MKDSTHRLMLSDLDQIEHNLKAQLKKVRKAQIAERGTNRFIFILPREQAEYLEWYTQKHDVFKSIFIRKLIDQAMRKDKTYLLEKKNARRATH